MKARLKLESKANFPKVSGREHLCPSYQCCVLPNAPPECLSIGAGRDRQDINLAASTLALRHPSSIKKERFLNPDLLLFQRVLVRLLNTLDHLLVNNQDLKKIQVLCFSHLPIAEGRL